jgi:hypothetical protein
MVLCLCLFQIAPATAVTFTYDGSQSVSASSTGLISESLGAAKAVGPLGSPINSVAEADAVPFGDAVPTSTTSLLSFVATEAVTPEASYTRLFDGGGGVIAHVDDSDVLNLAIEVGPATPRGGQMFNDGLSEVGPVNGIRGTWNPSMPPNLDVFNATVGAGMSVEDAARAMFAGTIAHRAGFLSDRRSLSGSAPSNWPCAQLRRVSFRGALALLRQPGGIQSADGR